MSAPALTPTVPASMTPAAAAVGVGPMSAPSVDNTALLVSPTVTAIENVLAKTKLRDNRASDVWHLFLPMASNMPEENESLLHQLRDKELPISFLTTKPRTPFVGRRLCLAEYVLL